MKIYIMTDMEGTSGIVNRSQVMSNGAYYEKGREWLTQDVNAAVQGAIDGGATDILVVDGHGANMAVNFLHDKLHPGAQYIQGTPWMRYLPMLDESYDGLFHVGAHAMSGTGAAILEHSWSSESWIEMTINGQPIGEIGLVAAIAGHYGVPFVMVSGDDKACAEAKAIAPEVECAVVKDGISRHCAKLLSRPAAEELIRQKANLAMAKTKGAAPFTIDSPVEIRIEYFRTEHADGIREREGVKKLGPRLVSFTGADIVQAFSRLLGG